MHQVSVRLAVRCTCGSRVCRRLAAKRPRLQMSASDRSQSVASDRFWPIAVPHPWAAFGQYRPVTLTLRPSSPPPEQQPSPIIPNIPHLLPNSKPLKFLSSLAPAQSQFLSSSCIQISQ